MHFPTDSPERNPHGCRSTQTTTRTSTRTEDVPRYRACHSPEEWCVEAETAEEARQLLALGEGHRCHLGDRLHAEVQELDE
jgi:hypothetical protein